jgi:hypothetical protein
MVIHGDECDGVGGVIGGIISVIIEIIISIMIVIVEVHIIIIAWFFIMNVENFFISFEFFEQIDDVFAGVLLVHIREMQRRLMQIFA